MCSHLQAPAERPEVWLDAQLAGDKSDAVSDTSHNQPRIFTRAGSQLEN